MVDREIIKEWIAKADEDFEFAKINLEEEKPYANVMYRPRGVYSFFTILPSFYPTCPCASVCVCGKLSF